MELSWRVRFKFGRSWVGMTLPCLLICQLSYPVVLAFLGEVRSEADPRLSLLRASFGTRLTRERFWGRLWEKTVAPSLQGLAARLPQEVSSASFCPHGPEPQESAMPHTGHPLVLQPSRKQTGPSVTCRGKSHRQLAEARVSPQIPS